MVAHFLWWQERLDEAGVRAAESDRQVLATVDPFLARWLQG
jgi:hypothetical protein